MTVMYDSKYENSVLFCLFLQTVHQHAPLIKFPDRHGPDGQGMSSLHLLIQ